MFNDEDGEKISHDVSHIQGDQHLFTRIQKTTHFLTSFIQLGELETYERKTTLQHLQGKRWNNFMTMNQETF